MTDNRHSIGATGDAEDEARGMPESFKRCGYGATEKDKLRYDTPIGQAYLAATKRPQVTVEIRANILIAAENLREALKVENQSDSMRYVLNALAALEKELSR
jgi:hypothetical protein